MPRVEVIDGVPHVRRYMYWKLDRDGHPCPDFTDTPHLYPHAEPYLVPVPESVQRCMEVHQAPAKCLILDKFGRPEDDCRKEEP